MCGQRIFLDRPVFGWYNLGMIVTGARLPACNYD
jgi:hypothetical protein